MPWCPKCDLEFKEGIDICSDCGTKLEEYSDSASLLNLVEINDEHFANKLLSFLHYSNIEKAQIRYLEEENKWLILVPKEAQTEALKLYHAFYNQEMEQLQESEEDMDSSLEEGESDSNLKKEIKSTAAYVSMKDKYDDLSSSASTFFIVGALCVLFLLLHVVGTLKFLNGVVPMTVLGIMTLGLFYLGIDSLKKAKELKAKIGSENDLKETTLSWLENTITRDTADKLNDENLSEEANLIQKLERIKDMVQEHFPEQEFDEAFLEQLIEDFYYDKLD